MGRKKRTKRKRRETRNGSGVPGIVMEVGDMQDTADGQEFVPVFRQRMPLPDSMLPIWAQASEDERHDMVRHFGETYWATLWEELETSYGQRLAGVMRVSSTIIDEQHSAGPPELRRIRGDVEDWRPLHVGDNGNSTSIDISSATNSSRRPLALVYRGIGATNRKECEDCSEVMAKLLKGSKYHFDVKYVGPKEKLKLSAETLKSAALYAQPGGDEDVIDAYNALKKAIPAIDDFVRNGGRYLGICMGGFLAPSRWAFNDRAGDSSDSPGFRLFPGKADRYIKSPGASVKNEKAVAVDLIWRGKQREMFFQDGPYFKLTGNPSGATILAHYKSNNEIAALVVPYGKGKVGVCGPHPEADKSWLSDVGNMKSAYDLGYDLIDTTMAGWSGTAESVSTSDGSGSTTKTTTATSGSPR